MQTNSEGELKNSNFYPEKAMEIVDFNYLDNLVLTRKIDAVKTRKGSDAKYIVAKDYRVRLDLKEIPEGEKFCHYVLVPENMATDLASVPFCFRWIVSRVGPHLEACIVHDWLYMAWKTEILDSTVLREKRVQYRKFSDDVLNAGMKKANVNPLRRILIYISVRLFGGFVFDK